MAAQIDFFQQLLKKKFTPNRTLILHCPGVPSRQRLHTYIQRNGNFQDLPAFTTSLINQLSANLKRIHGFGVRKNSSNSIAASWMPAIMTAFSSYQNCSESWNTAPSFTTRNWSRQYKG
ncbi:hypothetical protein NC653_026376 [Populus alba x Populus x berolinensis]|uniref:Uncharacterized protein n=1 Tax=Populus alba x Populus x berolinensis TaxID=444605 RepID=A0AAD6MDH2_9ROSI|nr:hypothetical protein NC653_026376 [Populus alba x Populus x berolinensis]